MNKALLRAFFQRQQNTITMRITVIAKNAGRRKELGKRQIELAKQPQTLQQLLEELTLIGLADAQAERTNQPLSQSDIDAQAEEGRVRFAESYATNNDTPEKSLERMHQAFVDGLFRRVRRRRRTNPNGKARWLCTKTANWCSSGLPCLPAFVGE